MEVMIPEIHVKLIKRLKENKDACHSISSGGRAVGVAAFAVADTLPSKAMRVRMAVSG